MTTHTDCRARRVKTMGCDCDFCRDNAILRDGETWRQPMLFLDATQQAMKSHFDGARHVSDGWPQRVFDAAGVPIREDALSPHERAMRGETRSPEEIDHDRRQQSEAIQQSRTAREADAQWGKALAKVNRAGGGVREASATRI